MTNQNALRHSIRSRAVTLVELLVTLVVSMMLVAAMSSAFIQIIRASDENEAQIRASNTARLAVDSIARELAQITPNTGAQELLLVDRPLTYGDRVDEDGDGNEDEEVFNALDDDGDWSAADDRHAIIVGGSQERSRWVGVPDYGDAKVDEDCVFSADEIEWIIPSTLSGSGFEERVSYSLGSFDGEDHVLLRTTETDTFSSSPTLTIEPIAFEVLSLDILAWDSNDTAAGLGTPSSVGSGDTGYWTSTWDASTIASPAVTPLNAPVGVPPFQFPTAFLVSIVVSAERVPLNEMGDPATNGRKYRTTRVSTIVNVEQTMTDPRYFTYVRDN